VLAIAVDATNQSQPQVMYDCDLRCFNEETPHFIKIYGHDQDGDGMPPDAFHYLGPWSEHFKLRRCPTHELGDRSELQIFFNHWKAVKAGIPGDVRGSDLWPDILFQSFMLIDPEKTLANDFVQYEITKRAHEKNKEN